MRCILISKKQNNWKKIIIGSKKNLWTENSVSKFSSNHPSIQKTIYLEILLSTSEYHLPMALRTSRLTRYFEIFTGAVNKNFGDSLTEKLGRHQIPDKE